MQAIEFIATLQNGTVTLPSEYHDQWNGKTIRVLLLEDVTAIAAAQDEHLPEKTTPLLTRLQQIKITAPADFSENLDQYLNGEKHG